MRIFVTGTGRCGTVSFSVACQHLTNFTSGHESHTGQVGNFEYPDNHIEVDPRLAFYIAHLKKKYPDALFIHLKRERLSCINSLAKRQSLAHFIRFHFAAPMDDIKKAATIYYDSTTSLLNEVIPPDSTSRLETIKDDWASFVARIQAEGDLEKASESWDTPHNQSKG